MSNYTLTPRAQADVEGIWIYTIARWDEAQAVSYIQQIKKAAEVIAAKPRHGRSCDDIRAGYFKYRVGSHVLFYRETVNGIDIIRILHERMDIGRHL